MAQLHLNARRTATAGEAIDLDALLRAVLLAAVFLILWITFRPFPSLMEPPEVTDAGNVLNQVGYSLLFIALAVWCMAHQPGRLLLLTCPIMIASLVWVVLSVIMSWEPALASRRLAYMLITLGIAAMAMLLPKNIRQFADVLAFAVLIILALCYLGVLFAPQVSIHQLSDFLEPELAGDWRGVFGHKNAASSAMVFFFFIGLFIARVRGVFLGGLIVILALTFLVFTQSKTSIAMLPVVLAIAALMKHRGSSRFGLIVALSGVVLLNVVSIGSIFFEPLRNLLDLILPDATFTGRTEVWQFALDHIRERPLFGFGYATFWGTPEVVYGMGGSETWESTVGHAHNSYLNLAVTIGIPGTILVAFWLVVLPLVDFYRAPHDPETAPLDTLFLHVCLFVAYGSCFESILLQEGGAALLPFMAVFGLRFLSVSRAIR